MSKKKKNIDNKIKLIVIMIQPTLRKLALRRF